MASIILKRTNHKMPLVGLGLWKITKSNCADMVYNAIKVGYRLFDGAGDYGNEKEAGEGVRRALEEGIVKREELFITSKAKAAAKMQLELWGLDYFDLFLVHFPVALAYVDPKHRYPPEWWGDDKKSVNLQNTPFQETWGAMEELVDEGLAKNIGVSNVGGVLLVDMLSYARIGPQVLQVELHPYLTQQPLLDLAKTLGIAASIKPLFDQDPIVKAAITQPAQILLRWATQKGIAVIPKTNDPARLLTNLNCTSFDLTEAEIQSISGLNINFRLNDPADIDPRLAIFA
ncbi:NADP-dependent oxidoreductase domain-containing protein [Lactarius indigo]|nr:NADP-dependent oxidoreductase domain-containing protein [Lactarius indigo]